MRTISSIIALAIAIPMVASAQSVTQASNGTVENDSADSASSAFRPRMVATTTAADGFGPPGH